MSEDLIRVRDTAVSRFLTNVRRAPLAPALVAEDVALAYAQLDRAAAALSGYIAGLGVAPGGLIGICANRSPNQITAQLAAWYVECGFLPLDPAWPDERIRSIVVKAGCTGLIVDAANANRIECTLPVVVLERDHQWIQQAEKRPVPSVNRDQLAYVIYTSGSSGEPKGVEITHGNVCHLVDWHIGTFEIAAADRGTHLAGLAFDASVWEIWPYLCAGASVALVPDDVRISAPLLQRWLIDNNATISFAPTAVAEQLIALDWPQQSPLRSLLTGGESLRRYPSSTLPFAFVNNYGPTECTVVATSGRVGMAAGASGGLPSIGRAIANTPIYILNDAGERLSSGEIGEIHVGGGGVGRGYRGDPKQTAERFLLDPFSSAPGRMYKTGDLGSLLPDGQIAFHGRSDEQIKIRGNRIELEEISQAMQSHPAIARCAVVPHRDAARGATQLVAYIKLVEGMSLSSVDVHKWLGERLPDYMVPASFVRVTDLPMTPNGKLDKAALPVPGPQNTLDQTAFAEPQSLAEKKLAKILAEVMERRTIGLDDNFFLIGGHSLLGTQVVLRASDAFGVELTLRHLFQAPTVRKLAKVIEGLIMETIEKMTEDEAQLRSGNSKVDDGELFELRNGSVR